LTIPRRTAFASRSHVLKHQAFDNNGCRGTWYVMHAGQLKAGELPMIPISGVACRAIVFLFAVVMMVPERSAGGQAPSWLRHIFTDSTGALVSGDLSPDRKWLVYTRDVSQQASEVLVRPVDGGAPRRLFDLKGTHRFILFSPKGDRVVFSSSLPQRDPSDISLYLMAAPFDTRTGTLTGQPRQISFDPIIQQPRFRPAISPDGSEVAYTEWNTMALKVVPITGGNARTLMTPAQRVLTSAPGRLAWVENGKAVRYEIVASPDQITSYKVRAAGGTPSVYGGAGVAFPGARVFAKPTWSARGRPASIRFVDERGKQVGNDLALPPNVGDGQFFLSADGKSAVFSSFSRTGDLRIVSTAGGLTGSKPASAGYEWPVGWTADSRIAISSDLYRGTPVYQGETADGQVAMRHAIPEGSGNGVAVIGSTIIEQPRGRTQSTYQGVNATDGSRRVLVAGVLADIGCCRAPGGAYTASGDEFYFERRANGQIEVRAATIAGRDRLVAALPSSTLGENKAVFGDRVAYTEAVGDSIRLQVKTGRSAPILLATFPPANKPTESACSWDGKRLAVLGGGPGIVIYQFDESGKPVGQPTRLDPPFQYQYALMWLRDGSALTMVALPREGPATHIALVPLADPAHPVILTREDPNNKWGHALSPDGRLVAYSSELPRGAELLLIDLAGALDAARQR
jgi:Tol biopolymer transport system component